MTVKLYHETLKVKYDSADIKMYESDSLVLEQQSLKEDCGSIVAAYWK